MHVKVLKLVVVLGILAWRFLSITGASGGFVEGGVDPRGFKLLVADEETGEAVRFNVCQPIHYVINPASAPEGGVEDVHRAFEITGRALGARFVYDGITTESHGDRDPFQPDRYGERWAPILVSWSDDPLHFDTPTASGDAVGLGGPSIVRNDEGQAVLVSGAVVFDATDELNSGFGGVTWGQVMLHELGHVFGLDHVNDETSVMYPGLGLRPADFGKGDRQGLWHLGIGSGCVKSPELPRLL